MTLGDTVRRASDRIKSWPAEFQPYRPTFIGIPTTCPCDKCEAERERPGRPIDEVDPED